MNIRAISKHSAARNQTTSSQMDSIESKKVKIVLPQKEKS